MYEPKLEFDDYDFFQTNEITNPGINKDEGYCDHICTNEKKDYERIFEDNIFNHNKEKNEEKLPEPIALMTVSTCEEEEKKNDENLDNPVQINLNKKKIDKKAKGNKKVENKVENNIHSRENDDNIRRKIKSHFHNFIVDYFNNLIKIKKKGNLKFKKTKYSYALNDTMKFNKILLLSKISDFFKLDISNKYKNYQKNENELVYEKLINRFDKDVLQLFDLTYMEFYEKYYLNEAFNNNSNFNNFYSLYEKERKKESDENKIKYSNLLKLIAEQRFINYYLPNRLFMTIKLFSN
jgi:hypothetical protein